MTERQHVVMEFIRSYRRQHGVSPTIQEVAEKLNLSRTSTFEHLCNLEKAGHLRRTGSERSSRSFEPVNQDVVLRDSVLAVIEKFIPDRADVVTAINKIPSQE